MIQRLFASFFAGGLGYLLVGAPPAQEPPPRVIGGPGGVRALLRRCGVEVPALSVQSREGGRTVYRFDVPAKGAVAAWQSLRGIVDESGYYPVICDDPSETLLENATRSEVTVAMTLAAAAKGDGIQWLRERAAKQPDTYGALKLGLPRDPESILAYADATDEELIQNWKYLKEAFTPTDFRGKPLEDVWIALVPTKKSHEVPAYFKFGNWNECPPAWVHVAVQRAWGERYGTEIVGVSGDAFGFRSTRPTRTLSQTAQFAREQFYYSGGDSVFQGEGTLMGVIEQQIGSPYTYVWWD